MPLPCVLSVSRICVLTFWALHMNVYDVKFNFVEEDDDDDKKSTNNNVFIHSTSANRQRRTWTTTTKKHFSTSLFVSSTMRTLIIDTLALDGATALSVCASPLTVFVVRFVRRCRLLALGCEMWVHAHARVLMVNLWVPAPEHNPTNDI